MTLQHRYNIAKGRIDACKMVDAMENPEQELPRAIERAAKVEAFHLQQEKPYDYLHAKWKELCRIRDETLK